MATNESCEPRESSVKTSDKEPSGPSGSGNGHKMFNPTKQLQVKCVPSTIPRNREDLLKWYGWGYKDSQFIVQDNVIQFTGNRYAIGDLSLPYFTQWVKDTFEVDLSKKNIPKPLPKEADYPVSKIDSAFLSNLEGLKIAYSVKGIDRLVRSHGQTLHDIYSLREGDFGRIPDVVTWPEDHDSVVKLVHLANIHNVVIIPFGGGTSVSGAVTCPSHEQRPIISLDTSQMNRILWLDHNNLVACCEAGIVGQDLERELQKQGYTTGHEPDSYEFSSLGGWVATRASGMKKNLYGNIEDLLVHVRMVTPIGVLEKSTKVPRMSCGPDFNHIIMGSEGTLGVITEIMLKIRPLPPCKKYGSIVFPDFETGIRFMREVARQRCQPASIRLMDNEQFKFGQALRPVSGYCGLILEGIKKIYITKIKGFDMEKMCVTTLVFEGEKEEVHLHEAKINRIAIEFGGVPAGERNGKRGYMLTFVIAYIRDLGLEHDVVAESFETSVAWDRTLSLCNNVKHRITQECKALGITKFLISCRVTQTYDVGSCVYFYFGFKWTGLPDPLKTYEILEERARNEILSSGGSLSHHHGVGKLRSRWFSKQVSQLGVHLYEATKRQLDPNNIFANGNLLHNSHL